MAKPITRSTIRIDIVHCAPIARRARSEVIDASSTSAGQRFAPTIALVAQRRVHWLESGRSSLSLRTVAPSLDREQAQHCQEGSQVRPIEDRRHLVRLEQQREVPHRRSASAVHRTT